MPALFSKVAVVGVGLIGGSFGMALRRTNLASEIIGVDLCAETLRLAVEREAIDQGFYELSLGVKDADLVVLAAPISYNLELLQKMKPYLKEGAIVTDVGSTKGDFVQKAELLLSPDQFFVGGHPMAGSEIGGIKRADPYLFENAYYLLTVTEKTDPKALDLVKSLAEGIGGRVLLVDPDDHDLMAAAISHLPHLIASTLVNTAAEINEKLPRTFSLAAGGFRDTTRIASGDPTLWKDICFNNKDKLLELIAIFKKELALFEQYLEQNDLVSFEKELAQAKELRDSIPIKLKGYWPFLEQIAVTVPDKPGMIGEIANVLAQAEINIDDIEILRVREGEGGSIRLGFAKQGAANQAVAVLTQRGIQARTID